MATTTNYGWTTPDDTALVKDGASAIRTLGSSIDTTTKALNPSTTLGDIEYRSSTANTNTRLPLGTAGQVLRVNSGATAPEWAQPSGVEPQINSQVSGYYVSTPRLMASSSQTLTVNTTYYTPVYLSGISFDRIGITTTATFSGTAVARLGIYNHNAATGKPNTVFLDAGTVSCTAASTDYLITISSTPPAGIYWLAINTQTAASTNSFVGIAAGSNAFLTQVSAATNTANKGVYWTESSITGAFATAATLTASTTTAQPYLRMV